MKTRFIDANIILGYLTQDEPEKGQACLALFRRAHANKITLTTTEVAISEVVYVLSSKNQYNRSRTEIRDLLKTVLDVRGLKIPHKADIVRALALYATHNIDYQDCVVVAHMEQQQLHEVYSYDRDFERFDHITRLEPESAEQHVLE